MGSRPKWFSGNRDSSRVKVPGKIAPNGGILLPLVIIMQYTGNDLECWLIGFNAFVD